MAFRLIARCGSCGHTYDFSDRFWAQVSKEPHPKGCWVWQGAITKYGYGKITVAGKTYSTHRVAYQFANGPIKKGRRPHDTSVCHTCDNRACVNPEHLYVGTMAENIYDRDSRGRRPDQRGDRHNMAKLTSENVVEIRRRAGEGERQDYLAAEFGVSKAMVSMIVNRKNWTHV